MVFIGWVVLASRPFCRTACPLGAFYALFNKVKLVSCASIPCDAQIVEPAMMFVLWV